ncbi:hypothetical protein [Bdellovibrio bacteriovorus]|uniref:Uncharacterized protein n=1 Tax=Bdellovibrio bacteriovorus str. Tiberius TaxID=1069642 RepID=K7YT43_BDEBC|nr:hypothetical protein [Bdellovibrio bacteriovorus]AFY00798.1 Hypothetical protein Bdt_1098 [Bdellovibrio bacteriovorus str. Tiberius]
MITRNLLLVATLCSSQLVSAASKEEGLSSSIKESGSTIDSYINLASKSQTDKDKYCIYLTSAIPAHNKSLGRFSEECGSVGNKIKSAQGDLKKHQDAIVKSKSVVVANQPTADMTDAQIKSLVQTDIDTAKKKIDSLTSYGASIKNNIRIQNDIFKKAESEKNSEFLTCINSGIWAGTKHHIPFNPRYTYGENREAYVAEISSACNKHPRITKFKPTLDSSGAKLKSLASEQAKVDSAIASLIPIAGANKAAAEEVIKKKRDNARTIIAGENAKIKKANDDVATTSAQIKGLQKNLADLNGGVDLCKKTGAKTLPTICK